MALDVYQSDVDLTNNDAVSSSEGSIYFTPRSQTKDIASTISRNVTPTPEEEDVAFYTPRSQAIDRVTTPQQQIIDPETTPFSSKHTTSTRSINHRFTTVNRFTPYPGNPQDPLDISIDTFFNSRTFELICIQAVQLACLLPTSPPPTHFLSFEHTPMHQWYQALLIEFVETFMRRLRFNNLFPSLTTFDPDDPTRLIQIDNEAAFNAEATAHINAILACFNANFSTRYRGSTEGLRVDSTQLNATDAAHALEQATSFAVWPPKRDWRVGEPLHAEYLRRLRMFESGVARLMGEREEKWILALPRRFSRGVDAYKEFWVGELRKEVLRYRGSRSVGWEVGR